MLELKEKYVLTRTSSVPERMQILFENGIPTHYKTWDEEEKKYSDAMWRTQEDFIYFDTQQEAEEYIRSTTPSPETVAAVMRHFRRDEKAFEEAFNRHFGEGRYHVPDFITERFERDEDEDDLPQGNFLDAIHQFIQEGTLNIDGATFRKEEMKVVKWGDGNDYECFKDKNGECPILIVLKDGTEIHPRNATERWFVFLAFGANYISDRIYNNIKIPD